MRFTRYTRFSLLPVHHMYCRLFCSNLNGYRALHALSLSSLSPVPCLAYFPSLLLSFLASSTSAQYAHFSIGIDLSLLSSLYRYISRLRFTSALKKILDPYRFLRFETFPSAFDRSYNFTGNGFEPVSFSIKILRFTLSY